MAKKKQDKTENGDVVAQTPGEALIAKLTAKYGQGCIISGDTLKEKKREIVSVSPSIDIGLGGGVPTGSWFILNGAPKLGKSSTALQFAANYQALGRNVYYMNIEARIKPRDLNVHNLKTAPPYLNIIESNPDKILTGMDYMEMGMDIMKSDPGCLLIYDSFSKMIDAKENTDGLGAMDMGTGKKALAQFCRLMAPEVSVRDSVIIGITQIMANIGKFGHAPATVEQSGFALQFGVDVKLKAKRKEVWLENDKPVGQKNTWFIETSGLDAAPCQEVVSYLRYGYGLDEIMELAVLGESVGLIEKAGAWQTASFMQQHLDLLDSDKWDAATEKRCKAQGEAQMYQLLKTNPAWSKALYEDIKAMLL